MKKEESVQTSRRKFPGNVGVACVSRRNFVKGAATIGAVAATVPLESLLGGRESVAEAASGNSNAASEVRNTSRRRQLLWLIIKKVA